MGSKSRDTAGGMRVAITLILSLALLTVVPTTVQAQEAGPGGPNLMKLQPGTVGADSIRIRVQHDPSAYQADSWQVISSTPGVANSDVVRSCDWGATGAPAATAGLFSCDLLNLPDGNHFITLFVTNVGRTVPSPNTYLWHTVGAATGIIDPDLPGSFATSGSAGSWDAAPLATGIAGPQRMNGSWPSYAASAGDFPTVGYLIDVESAAGDSQFVTDRNDLVMFLTASTYGDATVSVYPVTSRGLINSALSDTIDIPNQVASFQAALNLDQLVGAADFDDARDPQLLRYYVAYFDRQPDLGGAKYWLDIRRQGYTSSQIAGFMAASQEFGNNYAGTTDREYLTRIYQNVLGRDFDQAGFDYWLDTLQGTNVSGENPALAQISRSQVVFFVAQSVEFIALHPFSS